MKEVSTAADDNTCRQRPVDPAYHPVPTVLADSIGYLLHRGHVRAQGVAKELMPAGSHPRDFAVLQMLDGLEFGSQQELGEALCVNRTIMVSIVEGLEQDGYVERRRNPEDRRRYLLDLTEDGRSHLEVLHAASVEGTRRFEEPLTRAQVGELKRLLRPIALQRLTQEVTTALLDLSPFLVVHSHFRALQIAVPRLERLSMQPGLQGALRVLDAVGPVSQQRLAEELQVGGAAVVDKVDALERGGWVERRTSATDRRTNELVVTAKGRRDLKRATAIIDEVEAELTQDLGPNARQRLAALLHTLVTGSR